MAKTTRTSGVIVNFSPLRQVPVKPGISARYGGAPLSGIFIKTA